MNYGKINKHDIANGEGVRVSLFVSGCPHHCKGCFNPETWDYNYGSEFTIDTYDEIINALIPDHIAGLTILGGEPLAEKNIELVTDICYYVKYIYRGDKSIWLYTGYDWEIIKNYKIMEYIDVLVDGRFIERFKDISLKFRGSANQRIIDVPASLSSGSMVLKEV